ncbi:putative ubiquitin carboxyl-terminal hydrolase FAF-X [Trebouxia sp. C0009 RCD-2024]
MSKLEAWVASTAGLQNSDEQNQCWAVVGIQCLIRDRVVSQWLQELLTPSSGLDHADAELPITDVLDICRGLVHEAAPRANVDPVILVQKLRSHDEVLLEELLKVRMSPEPKCFQHQDWAEGFELLMRVLTDTTPADYGPGILKAVFQHSIQTYFVCGHCPSAKTLGTPQPGWILHLAIEATSNLTDALDNHFMASKVEDKVECAASRKLQYGVRCHRICRLSPTLVVNMKRTKYQSGPLKIDTPFCYPLDLDLEKFCTAGALADGWGSTYQLGGVVLHTGNAKGGHYRFVQRMGKQLWWLRNDDTPPEVLTSQAALAYTREACALIYLRTPPQGKKATPGSVLKLATAPMSEEALLDCITPLTELPLRLTPAHQRTAVQQQQVQQRQAQALLKAAAAAKAGEEAKAAQQAKAAEQRAAAGRASAKMVEGARQRQQQEGKERLAGRAHRLKTLDQEQSQLQATIRVEAVAPRPSQPPAHAASSKADKASTKERAKAKSARLQASIAAKKQAKAEAAARKTAEEAAMLQQAAEEAAAFKQAEDAQAAVRMAEQVATAAAAAAAALEAEETGAAALSHVVNEEPDVAEGRAEHAVAAAVTPSSLGQDSDGFPALQAPGTAQLSEKLDGVKVEPTAAADPAQDISGGPISLPMADYVAALPSTVEEDTAAAAAKKPHAVAAAAAAAAKEQRAVAAAAAAAAAAAKVQCAGSADKEDKDLESAGMAAVQSADEEGPQSPAPQKAVLTALPQGLDSVEVRPAMAALPAQPTPSVNVLLDTRPLQDESASAPQKAVLRTPPQEACRQLAEPCCHLQARCQQHLGPTSTQPTSSASRQDQLHSTPALNSALEQGSKPTAESASHAVLKAAGGAQVLEPASAQALTLQDSPCSSDLQAATSSQADCPADCPTDRPTQTSQDSRFQSAQPALGTSGSSTISSSGENQRADSTCATANTHLKDKSRAPNGVGSDAPESEEYPEQTGITHHSQISASELKPIFTIKDTPLVREGVLAACWDGTSQDTLAVSTTAPTQDCDSLSGEQGYDAAAGIDGPEADAESIGPMSPFALHAAHDSMPADEGTAEAPAVSTQLDDHSSQVQDDAASADAAAVMPTRQAHSSGRPAAFGRHPAARAAARSRAYCGHTRARFGQLRQPACIDRSRQECHAFALPMCDPGDLWDSWWGPQRCPQAETQPDSQPCQHYDPLQAPTDTR